MFNSARNSFKKSWESVVLGSSCGFGVVSTQFHIVHTYNSHHTKGEHWKSHMKSAAPIYIQILKNFKIEIVKV